jgi:hypothetical protein
MESELELLERQTFLAALEVLHHQLQLRLQDRFSLVAK